MWIGDLFVSLDPLIVFDMASKERGRLADRWTADIIRKSANKKT